MITIGYSTRESKPQFKEYVSKTCGLKNVEIIEVVNNGEKSLPQVYNELINQSSNDICVFCHDDIWIDDSQIGEHLISAIDHFDIAGVAGCETRVSNQAAWSFQDPGCSVPVANASGMIAHGTHPSGEISYYGPSCRPCELLDGVFIAVRLNTFQRYPQLRFDCQFSFHFYDIDFCRTALLMGLRMGTWPIAITHSSKGSYKGALWQESYESYIAKWGE